ncbi:MAG: DMT family transporter [Granulosicoccus sp.]|nr:DMT family transporter [Granulosicoccus sp.]
MTQPESRLSQTSLGMLWMLLTGLCFVGVTVTVRYIGPRIPATEAAFLRYVFGTIMLTPILFRLIRGSLKIQSWTMMGARGIAHGLGVSLWFFAMARLPIAEVTALGYVTPILVTLGAALFLGERLQIRRLFAIALGLIGVMTILRPGFSPISIGQFAQLAATPLFAASFLLAKKMTGKEDLTVIVAGLSVVCTLALLPGAVINWTNPYPAEIALLILTAFLATVGHYTMTRAFSLAPLATLQPVNFLQLLWATLLGVILFGESIDIFVVIGGTILVISTSYIAHREAVIDRRRKEAEKNRGKIG